MNPVPITYADMRLIRDDDTGETLSAPGAPLWLDDDFIYARSAEFDDNWLARDTGAATEDLTADANGVVGLGLTNANEIQLAGRDRADQRVWTLNQKLAIEIRFRFTVLPTGSVVAVLGLCGNHNAAVNTVAESIWFRADGSGAITVETDDTVNETSQVATGTTLTASTWIVARIECETTTAIRFYLNGARVASATTFNMSTVAALALQPVMRIGKEAAATTVGTLQVDYVRLWQQRS